VAHTIKGSLSSLHATLARHHAQALESAAKNRDGSACRANLQALADDLGALEPLLLKLRDEVQQ
jgi:HPt (histidine-containing phosphotransfer) domain-containing protein